MEFLPKKKFFRLVHSDLCLDLDFDGKKCLDPDSINMYPNRKNGHWHGINPVRLG
jgi:hypothetical protein